MKKLITKIRSALPGLSRVRQAGRWRSVLLSLAVLLLFFVLGFRLFFPIDALRSRLQSEFSRRAGSQVGVEHLSLGLPLSVKLQGVRLESPQQGIPVFDIDMVELSPGWLSLVSGDPEIDIRGELYEGALFLNLARSGRFALQLDGLHLDRLPAMPLFETPIKLAGTASGQVEAAAPPLSKRSDTVVQLRIDNAAVTGLEPLGIADGQVALGNILATGELHGRKFDIESVRTAGGDFRLEGKGNLLIGANPARTRLNLQIDLQPQTGLEPMLRDLLSLSGSKPAPDGSYRFRLSGSLARPVLR